MTVKIKFISDLEYQLKAINSITKLFEGALAPAPETGDFGIVSNPDIVSIDMLNENLTKIQKVNTLPLTKVANLKGEGLYDRPNFSIEMETGTGKTYIFLRTILELYKKFNLKKFIIVVPSVAIREGILENLRITKPHFEKLYDRTPCDFRVFSSDNLSNLSAFSRSNKLEILVITIQSFNKEEINTLYETGRDDVPLAERGIDMLAQTNPVLILDEPHKMGSELAASALNNLNPLFLLRYSATHRDLEKSNLIYSLGPAEAYNSGLVKKIDVIGTSVRNEESLPLIRFISVSLKPKIRARIMLKVRGQKGTTDKLVYVSKGDSLAEKTKNPAYNDLAVLNISGEEGKQYIELSGGLRLRLNESKGDIYLHIAKEQIENTIRTHFEKQEKLRQHGVKVLSLFFVDEVSDYQEIDSSKEAGKDELAAIDHEKYLFVKRTFDELFNRIKKEYPLWNYIEAEDVRGAYFSPKKTFASIAKDKEKIDEILSDKGKLLSFDSPTSFVFTHSALGEGWDNPNVFNICTLRVAYSEITKRQTIGRGLRIPVNQTGERYENPPENVLTVIANESYEVFAKTLQDDYEADGIVTRPPVENRRNKITSKLRTEVFNGEFRELWEKLKLKTEFKSEIKTDELIEKCSAAIKDNLIVKKPILMVSKAAIEISAEGIKTVEKESEPAKQVEIDYIIPDLVTRVSNETNLTRKTISQILIKSGRLTDVFKNPEEFISGSIAIIKEEKLRMEVETAKYLKSGDKYSDEIFEEEVESYKTNVIESPRSVYDKVICDNGSERAFAEDLTEDEQVRIFCKLPQNFYVGTPTGNYRPDWAILYQRNRLDGKLEHKLYLVRETKFGYTKIKGTRKSVPPEEQDKIDCALKHFREIGAIDYAVVFSIYDFKESLPN